DGACQTGPGGQDDAGKAESGSPGREEAFRHAACAANDGLAQVRASGAGRVGCQRRRIGGGACLLPADGRRTSATFQAVPARRQGRGPAGHRAGQLHAQPKRCGAFRRPRRLVRPFGAGCRDADDGAPRPAVSRIPRGREAILDAVQRAGGVLYPIAMQGDSRRLLRQRGTGSCGISKLTVLLSITWCVGSASSNSTLWGPAFSPTTITVSPLASTKCQGASSTVMWT